MPRPLEAGCRLGLCGSGIGAVQRSRGAARSVGPPETASVNPCVPPGLRSREARLLASGALLQQARAGLSGLLALLVIVTVLARRLTVAELGAYGLVASLAGYLLVLRNSVASSARAGDGEAATPAERARMFARRRRSTPWSGWPRGC